MKTCSGFIKNVERITMFSLLKFSGEFDALRFAAGGFGGGLAEAELTIR